MKQGRTPDRVHVVRPPQDDYRPGAVQPAPAAPGLPAAPQNSRAMEIVRTLAQISDKLKRSEAERYELLAELREYRKALNELEDKADKSEKAYLALENKLKTRDTIENEISQRQARFERALKDTENKLVQAAAGQTLLDKRINEAEEWRTGVIQRIDESVSQQARLDRTIEKITQDKTRMYRKVERMEEILTETQDTLKARALVLLTDQSAAAKAGLPQIAAYADDARDISPDTPWWRRSVRMQGVGMASMVIAALLFGWTINQIQQPDIPKIAILENGGVAKLNLAENKWEPVEQNDTPTSLATVTPQEEATLTPVDAETVEDMNAPEAQEETAPVLNASDDELLAALENDPERLAAQLNDIEPQAREALEETAPPPVAPKNINPDAIYNPLEKFGKQAYLQDPKVASDVAKEKGNRPIGERIGRDETLPDSMLDLENQAFAGIPEAQHDLAAIYTAGRGGVTQNFERAALWFREAADQDVGNAAYNLGVLYHQGLGVEKELDKALYWYREAAKLGHPEAQYNLGISYIEGIGVDYNAPLAAAFFESSANKGVVEAAYNLGLIYENGLINGAKSENALLWYKIAADGGNSDAKAALIQLSSSMQIGMEDVNKMVDRMQSIYASNHGRRAGPDKPKS